MAQVSDGSGMLLGTFVQVPREPASPHVLQASLQAVVQQTPWAQTSDAHSVLLEQKAPGGFLPHEVAVQKFPGEQFTSAVHLS